MPIWVWVFFAVVISYGGLVLWRAWSKNYVKFGPVRFTREADATCFYFLTSVFFLSEIIAISLLALAILSLVRGPVFQQ